jgi:hypothetical protein
MNSEHVCMYIEETYFSIITIFTLETVSGLIKLLLGFGVAGVK